MPWYFSSMRCFTIIKVLQFDIFSYQFVRNFLRVVCFTIAFFCGLAHLFFSYSPCAHNGGWRAAITNHQIYLVQLSSNYLFFDRQTFHHTMDINALVACSTRQVLLRLRLLLFPANIFNYFSLWLSFGWIFFQ